MTLRVAIIEDSADLLDELLAFLRFRGFDAWGYTARKPSGGSCIVTRWILYWLILACLAKMASAFWTICMSLASTG